MGLFTWFAKIWASCGWQLDAKTLKLLKELFVREPGKLHRFLDMVGQYVLKKTQSPGFRIRSEDIFGPRIVLTIEETKTTGLEDPESFFVELNAYLEEGNERPAAI